MHIVPIALPLIPVACIDIAVCSELSRAAASDLDKA